MSSRRSRQQSASTRISDDQIIDLVSKLRQLVPEIRDRRSDKVLFQKPFSLFMSQPQPPPLFLFAHHQVRLCSLIIYFLILRYTLTSCIALHSCWIFLFDRILFGSAPSQQRICASKYSRF